MRCRERELIATSTSPWYMKRELAVVRTLAGLFLTGCFSEKGETPPFIANDEIGWTQVVHLSPRAGWENGEFTAWKLTGLDERIAAATSSLLVRKSLYWHHEEGRSIEEVLNYFEALGGQPYSTIRSEVQNVISDPEYCYAFVELSTSKRGVEHASVWLCSARRKRLVYLSE